MTRYQALTLITVAATLVLISIGSFVRTTGSGLGCPDWPLCHGGLLPPWERTAIIEYSHRTFAALVGLLILATAVATVRLRRRDTAAVALAVASLPLLAFQAWLGKETVERELPPMVVTSHLTMALVLFAVLSLIALFAFLGAGRERIKGEARRGFLRLTLVATVVMALIIVIGSYTVGTGAGFACSGWPHCPEAPIPFIDGDRLEHIHWLHRISVVFAGGLVLGVVGAVHMMRRKDREPLLHYGATLLGALFLLQVVSGALNIWSDFAVAARVLHLALGSATWATLVVITVGARYRPEVAPQPASPRPRIGEPSGARV